MCRLAGSSQAVLSSAVREEESSCTAQHLPTAVSRLPTWQMPQMLLLLLFSNMLASCEMLLFFFSFLPSIIDMTSLHKHSHVLYLHIHWEFFEDQPIFIGPCFLLPLPNFFALFWSHLTTGNGSSSPLLCLPCPSCHWQGLFSVRGVSKHKHDPPEAVCFWLFRIPWQQIRGLGFFVPLMCCS